jgi:biopolymer transport protein TolR
MAMGVGGAEGGLSSEINMTPMIDVLLVLLVIFMVVQPLSRRAHLAQVPPEQQQQQQQKTRSDQIVLEIMADGSYRINTVPLPKDQLDAKIHEYYDNRPAKLLFVRAHPSRKYQEVIDAMDVARGAGVQVIGFTPPEAAKRG